MPNADSMSARQACRTAPVVHIGFHKTATTWFQNHVWPACTSHDFIPRKVTQAAFLARPGLHFTPEEAHETLEVTGGDRPLLLSEENLSGYIHNGGLHGLIGPEMARRIKATFPDARIAIFIRNQPDVVRASYAQYVSGGGTFSAKRYFFTHTCSQGALTRPYKAPAFEFEHFEYDRLIAHFDGVFGKEQVHVFPYEWIADRAKLSEFLKETLGLDMPDQVLETGKTANRSFGPMAMTILRGVNQLTRQSVVNKSCLIDLPGGQGLRHAAKAVLQKIPGMQCGASLPPKILEHTRMHYLASNRRLAALRDIPLDALGYPI